MRRKYTVRDNVISFAIGCVIAIPICCYAWRSWHNTEPIKEEKKDETTYISVSDLNLPTAGVARILEGLDIESGYIEQTTGDDLTEEAYYDELDLLATCVMAEAGNQDLMGKRMVVDVILNRVDDPDFPDTITGVITQKYHFSSYWDGAMDRADPNEECFQAITMELEERSYPSILYFTAGEFGDYGTPWKQYGDHYFCTK